MLTSQKKSHSDGQRNPARPPCGLNGQWHYPDCEAKLNSDPGCECPANMAKQISVLAQECGRLMGINRQLKKQLDRATNE